MTKKRTTKRTQTPEQRAERAAARKAEMEQLHSKLGDQVEALRSSERWAAYLAFCSSFHSYSFSNLLLIFAQFPGATRVAGYRTWQGNGRQVRTGERSIRIIGTGTRAVSEEDEETGEKTTTGQRRVFFPLSVFDIAQSDPIEGHEDPTSVAVPLTGADEDHIYARVEAHLTAQGFEVQRRAVSGGANGYTTWHPDSDESQEPAHRPLLIVIEETLSPAHAAKTALHEAAHIALGHLGQDFAAYVEHRGRYEVEAESVAFVLAGVLGLDAIDYSTGYVAGWMSTAETDVLKTTASAVLTAAHALIEALETTEPDAETGPAAA